jgi:hypothetical protein
MNYNKFSEIRNRLLTGENNQGLLLDSLYNTQQKKEEQTLLDESEKKHQLQQIERENELKRQHEIIQQQKEEQIKLTEIEKQKQIQELEKENEWKRQQEFAQQQKDDEIRQTEIKKQKQIQQLEKKKEWKHQQDISQQQKDDEIRQTEIEKQKQIQELEKENEWKRQQEFAQQQKDDNVRQTEIEKQKQIQELEKENEWKHQQESSQQKGNSLRLDEIEKQRQSTSEIPDSIGEKIIKDKSQNKLNNTSLIKVSILSIFSSILICGIAFFFYTKYYEDNAIRDATKAFNILTEQNHNYYSNKETIYKDFLKSFASSNTYNTEINSKLKSDLKALENKKELNLAEANKNINELRNVYQDRKGSLADFDYAYNKMLASFKNKDSIDILLIENKVNKIITLFSQQNSDSKISTEKIKYDIINRYIFGWGKIETNDIKSIVFNTELSSNNKYIVSINLEKNSIKSTAELSITCSNDAIVDVKTNQITFPNVAPANSWFNFTPLPNSIIHINTNRNPISIKSCENCSPIMVNSSAQNQFTLDDFSQIVSITSETNADVVVYFTYIPKPQQ